MLRQKTTLRLPASSVIRLLMLSHSTAMRGAERPVKRLAAVMIVRVAVAAKDDRSRSRRAARSSPASASRAGWFGEQARMRGTRGTAGSKSKPATFSSNVAEPSGRAPMSHCAALRRFHLRLGLADSRSPADRRPRNAANAGGRISKVGEGASPTLSVPYSPRARARTFSTAPSA